MIKVEYLDKRICDIENDCNNKETFRQFIRTSEDQFGMDNADLDSMSDEQLDQYVEFLDYLWDK